MQTDHHSCKNIPFTCLNLSQKKSILTKPTLFFQAMRGMRCFSFSHRDKTNDTKTIKSTSNSSPSISNGQDETKSGSGFTSLDASDVSNESSTRVSFTTLTQRSSRNSNNNIRVFTFAELKSVTRNFSRALIIGEGGFGCVYRAVLRTTDGSNKKIDVAVKQLGRRGLQVDLFFWISCMIN